MLKQGVICPAGISGTHSVKYPLVIIDDRFPLNRIARKMKLRMVVKAVF